MKFCIKKQNSRFTLYWNYPVEDSVKEAKRQQQEYLDKPAQHHIDETVELFKRFKEKVNDNTELNIARITANVNEYRETAQKILQLTVEEYYNKYLVLICDITGEKIPYDTDYYYIEHDDEGHCTIMSLNGLKELQKQITEFIN